MNEHDRANQLYWESDASVNDIADQMDLSKGTLYQLIEPLAAEVDCPDCGSMLEYPNRTAFDKGLMQCSVCGRKDVLLDSLDQEPTHPVLRGSEAASSRSFDPVADRQGLIGVALLGTAALLYLMGRSR